MRGAALWTLARPAMVPWLWALVGIGFGWAHWIGSWDLLRGPAFLGLLGAWLAVHAGTMWLNAALDRDEGEVLFGEAAALPEGISRVAYLALGLGAALGLAVDERAGLCLVGAALLAVVYSHPRIAGKGHPLLGPAVNAIGYGLLAPGSGCLLLRQPFEARTAGIGLLLALGMLGLTFLAQSFQREEDAARGYRTLVVTHGPAACVFAARVALGLGSLVYGLLVCLGEVPRLTVLGLLPLPYLLRRLAPTAAATRDALFRLGVCLLVALVLAGVDHLGCLLRGEPGAGLCVAARRDPVMTSR